MKTPALVLMITCLLAGCAGQEAETAEATADPNPLDGAWRVVQMTSTAADGSVTMVPQVGVRLMVDGHFSLVRLPGNVEREPGRPGMSTSERAAMLSPVTAQGGTFELENDLLIERLLVAKNPQGMAAGNFRRLTHRIAGDTLDLSLIETTNGPAANPSFVRYVRAGANAARTRIDGAWRRVAIITSGPEGSTAPASEPGLRLYAAGHYSQLYLTGPRPTFDSTVTDEERVAIWGVLTANSGTFEVAGDTVRSHAIVAMNPAVMAPDRAPAVRTYRMQADTLWLTLIANAQGPLANPTTEVLVRARNK